MEMDEKKFRFLIDGFPRNEDNLQGWTTVMEGKANVKFVLFFDCTSEVIKHLRGRVSKRKGRGRNGRGKITGRERHLRYKPHLECGLLVFIA